MANEDSILREVDQELAEDRQWAMFRKHGPAVIGGAVAIVAAVAGWQVWTAQKLSTAKKQALEYRSAVELLADDMDAGRAALNAIAEEGGGYGVLASLQRAGSYASGGERLKAIETYRALYSDNGAPKRVRELARLRAAYLSLADGRDAVLTDLGDLVDTAGPYNIQAREISALAALDAKDYETALAMFRQIAIDTSAPQALRARAEDFAALASAGKAGVNLTGETSIGDLQDILAPEDGGDNEAENAAETAEEETTVPDEAASGDDLNIMQDSSDEPVDQPAPSENETE